MLKCTVVGCTDTCFKQCYKRVSPQRAEAIKALNIHSIPVSVGDKCDKCGRSYIRARRDGVLLMICGCRVD